MQPSDIGFVGTGRESNFEIENQCTHTHGGKEKREREREVRKRLQCWTPSHSALLAACTLGSNGCFSRFAFLRHSDASRKQNKVTE